MLLRPSAVAITAIPGTRCLSATVTGMHGIFAGSLPIQYFIPQPSVKFGEKWDEKAIEPLKDLLKKHAGEIAALILEPIVQGAGGMYFYSPCILGQGTRIVRPISGIADF